MFVVSADERPLQLEKKNFALNYGMRQLKDKIFKRNEIALYRFIY